MENCEIQIDTTQESLENGYKINLESVHLSSNIDTITTEESKVIKPINYETVHKICSGQVVFNLAIAVKELVENALDAGASNIEIKLKEYGSELIEVIDNGSGVLEQNFAALTLKHCTSKIKEFTDLESLETLGFRGEALSSLCALSNVSITTRHSSANVATKIIYDHHGKIISQACTSRSEGTTVSLSNLFSTLPVRRKDFMKNMKREFNKMCQLLYAYGLVSVNVKITCSNQTNKGTKTTVMATQASTTVRENIINVFGSKQISSLIDIFVTELDEAILNEYGLKLIPKEEIPFKFQCFISSVVHGSGRSTSDRQFYYINSRPCEPTKAIKLVNDIYRQFNGNQYPFVYLNILIERKHVDVNVTPDKRQIFLDKEKLLLAALKSSLLEAFKNFPSMYSIQNVNVPKRNEVQKTLNDTLKGLKRTIKEVSETPSQASLLDCFKKKMKKSELMKEEIIKPTIQKSSPKKCAEINITIDNDNCINSNQSIALNTKDSVSVKEQRNERNVPVVETNEILQNDKFILNCKYSKEKEIEMIIDSDAINSKTECEDVIPATSTQISNNSLTKETIKDFIKSCSSIKNVKKEQKNMQINSPNNSMRATIVNTSIEAIEEELRMRLRLEEEKNENETTVKFRSQIAPDSNKQAEQELQKQITKDKFKEMEIIGQFNLGFIIAKLENDLFIIDQHATDEKYNFEQLQMNTVLETQVLVNPKPLQLTAANESLLIENEDIFRKNGFNFLIDDSAEATKKIRLTAIPISKNYSFGKDDVDELLFMLQDGNGMMCRPSRVRQMFASRACRKSVMIGTAMTKSDMRKLVDHMGEIDQPWNCPHGRPTMRHLINLGLIQDR